MKREVHFVGSIRLESAEEVFKAIAERVGARAPRWPDGETGERHYWIVWQGNVFKSHPAFEQDEQPLRPGSPVKPFRLKEGAEAADLAFGPLGYSAAAKESYGVFSRLRDEGVVPPTTRFMVALPTPTAVVTAFVHPDVRPAVIGPYEAAMARERDEIVEAVPNEDLAIQWDVMHEVVANDGGPFELHYGDVFGGTIERLKALSARIPEAVDLGFHLCYGDPGHKHIIEPANLGTSVKFANAIVSEIGRRIDWIHMAVPRDRTDDAYFAPLERLDLPAATSLVLGLIHHTDGIEGTRRRIETAERHRKDFSIATECGFGRREPSTMLELLDIHAAVADG